MNVGTFVPPWGPTATPDQIDRLATAIEELGYQTLWVGDHVVFPRVVESAYPYNAERRSPFDPDQPLYEPATLLAYLAARTQRIRLGVSVLVLPQRDPVLAAKQLAAVDALSRGRLVVGVGAGWMREEFDALDAPFGDRGARMDEWMEILRHLWGARGAFRGRFRSFDAAGMVPARQVPLLVGGQSAPALRRAARQGDGWNGVRLSVDATARAVDKLHRLGHREPFEVVVRGPLGGPEELEAYRAAGVTEYVVEVPDVTTGERIRRLRELASALL